MERPRPVVVLACLALVVAAVPPAAVGAVGESADHRAGAASSAGTATAPMTATENTTSRLVLVDYRVTHRQFETAHVEMGGPLAAAVGGVADEHARRTIEHEFAAAETRPAKRSVIDGALRTLEDRVDRLEARERAAIRSYSDGNISGTELLRRLARVDASAREVERTVLTIRRLARNAGIDRFDSRVRDVAGHAEQLRGPVRHQAGRAMAGETVPARVRVTASDEGVVLATLAEGQYLREASRWRSRNASALPELDQGEFFRRVEELYPWVTSRRAGETGFHWRGNGVWRFRATHSQGELSAYVDAATAGVFREIQRLDVAELPTSSVDHSERGLQVVLERIYVGGPVRVVVQNAANGAAVNAVVTVEGTELGTTGADGVVWTIEPTMPYTVNVTHDETTVSVTIDRPFLESEG